MCRESRRDPSHRNNRQIETMKHTYAWNPYVYCLAALCMVETVYLRASPACSADGDRLSRVANGGCWSAYA
jgi:hypothetical protein